MTFNRLTSFTRADGTSASWNLDAVGNWNSSTSNGTTTTRTNNAQNQQTDATYDANGNLISRYDDVSFQICTYKYDAWNRLVSVTARPALFINDPPTRTIYAAAYDALGRPIVETTAPVNAGTSTTKELYYSDRGQVIEERQGGATTTQYVWSPFYVNQLVERDDQPDASGNLTRRLYAEQDANYNVTSLTDASGNVVERYVYDPYGTVTVEAPDGIMRGDGSVNSSAYSTTVLFQGGKVDTATGLYHFKTRDYDPESGKWMQQDTERYVDGPNDYEIEESAPLNFVDPNGTDSSGQFSTPPSMAEANKAQQEADEELQADLTKMKADEAAAGAASAAAAKKADAEEAAAADARAAARAKSIYQEQQDDLAKRAAELAAALVAKAAADAKSRENAGQSSHCPKGQNQTGNSTGSGQAGAGAPPNNSAPSDDSDDDEAWHTVAEGAGLAGDATSAAASRLEKEAAESVGATVAKAAAAAKLALDAENGDIKEAGKDYGDFAIGTLVEMTLATEVAPEYAIFFGAAAGFTAAKGAGFIPTPGYNQIDPGPPGGNAP